MQTRWVVFASILVANAVAAMVLALLVSRRRNAQGSGSAVMLFMALALWTFAYAAITISSDMPAKIFWLKVENLGILSTPVFWFLFALRYSSKEKLWSKWYFQAALWIIPIISLAFLFSETWFSLYYQSIKPFDENGGPLVIGRGPWYGIQLILSYGLLIAGLVLFTWHMFRMWGLYRRQVLFFLVGIIVPVGVNLFYQVGAKASPQFYTPIDLTPISLTLTAGFISIGVFGLRMFDLIPIARNVVFENIPEMVLVVDAYNRVLDINRTAEEWLRKPAKEIIGYDLMKTLGLWPGLAVHFQSTNDVREEINVPGVPPRTLELIISPLRNNNGELEGRVILARDISGRKSMETELKNTNQALKARIAEVDALRAKLQEQTIRDPLTGLYNRRHLAVVLDDEVVHTQKTASVLSITVIDLDYFKNFNDSYGHKGGDVVLLAFARFLTNRVHEDDTICRYGGEEFVIVMPNTSLESALEQVQNWINSLQTKTFEYKGKTLHQLTMSVGIAAYPVHGADGEAVLQAADQALYQSKANGRNQVTVYAPVAE